MTRKKNETENEKLVHRLSSAEVLRSHVTVLERPVAMTFAEKGRHGVAIRAAKTFCRNTGSIRHIFVTTSPLATQPVAASNAGVGDAVAERGG